MVLSRTACVDVPALPLQLLLRQHPQWRAHPVAVVQDDRPQGRILWANVHARRRRVLPGMTFAAAQSLAADLRAATVCASQRQQSVDELHRQLAQFSPHVEPSTDDPGVFWLDPRGLVPLYSSLEEWAHTLRRALQALDYRANIVVGFHRYRCYALARAGHRFSTRAPSGGQCWVLPSPRTETQWCARVPLADLHLSPELRDQLAILGIHTLGQFLGLPQSELSSRFGEEAALLHRKASDRWTPLRPRPLEDPVRGEFQLDPPDADHSRLLFALRGTLHRLLDALATRSQALSTLHLTLVLDHAPRHHEYIEPAHPTLELPMLVDLVRLRLDALRLPAAVEAVELELEGVATDAQQLALFQTQKRRDLEAASRALARLRAMFGPEAVTRPMLRAAHLPEASFAWTPSVELRFPRPQPPASPPLCRRLFHRPLRLPARPRHEPEGWLGPWGAVRRMNGPYRISGGWWVRTVERDYYFAETQTGTILWIYYDRPRQGWFLQGIVD